MVDRQHIEKLFEAAKLSQTERGVLAYLISHLDEAESLNIKDVASECFTSSTTVIRLSKKLNYRGFREMVFDLRRFANPHATGIGSSQAGNDFTCSDDAIEGFREALARGGSICLYGEGWSSIVTDYMEKKLIISGHQVVSHAYLGTNTLLKRIPNLDTAIFVSKGGSTISVTEAARRCQLAEVRTFAFTGNVRGKLTQYADGVFTVQDDDPFDSENRSRNLFFARCIAAFEELMALCGRHPKYDEPKTSKQ